MPDRCPHCGLLLLELQAVACPGCGKSLPGATGITTKPSSSEGSVAEGLPPAPADANVPNIANPSATAPSCPPVLLIIVSCLLCAGQGAMIHFGQPDPRVASSMEAAVGAIIGALIGLALAVDHRFFRQKLRTLTTISADDPDDPMYLPNVAQPPSEWVSIVMLVLAVGSGIIGWFGRSLGLTEYQLALIGSGVIIATAVLGYVSIRQLALHMDRHRTYHGALADPAFVYLAMLFIWLVCYPLHFVTRWRMGGRNLIVPGLIATAVYCAPLFKPLLTDPELPSVDDAQVLLLVKQVLEDEPTMRPVTLKQPIEVSFDEVMQKRFGRCVVHSKHGDEPVAYLIDWRDRPSGIWQIQLTDRLPLVNTPEVLEQLRLVIEHDLMQKGGQMGVGAITIRNPQQVSYDPVNQKRVGRAVRNSQMGDVAVHYVVEWHGAERKLFNVAIRDRQP